MIDNIGNRTRSRPHSGWDHQSLTLYSIKEECSLPLLMRPLIQLLKQPQLEQVIAFSRLLIIMLRMLNYHRNCLIRKFHLRRRFPLWTTQTLSVQWCQYYPRTLLTLSKEYQPMVSGNTFHIWIQLSMACGCTVLNHLVWAWDTVYWHRLYSLKLYSHLLSSIHRW